MTSYVIDCIFHVADYDEALKLAAVGDSTEVIYDVTIDPSWNPANLDAMAFVQNDDTMEMVQSARLEAR